MYLVIFFTCWANATLPNDFLHMLARTEMLMQHIILYSISCLIYYLVISKKKSGKIQQLQIIISTIKTHQLKYWEG